MTQRSTFYTSEAIDYLVVVSFPAGSRVTSLTGSVVRADAINKDTGAKVPGICSVLAPDQLRTTFPAGILPQDGWELQTLVTPPGELPSVVDVFSVTIKAGAI